MTVRIWQAFSSNNSSSSRLVARFRDQATAANAAAALAATKISGFELMAHEGPFLVVDYEEGYSPYPFEDLVAAHGGELFGEQVVASSYVVLIKLDADRFEYDEIMFEQMFSQAGEGAFEPAWRANHPVTGTVAYVHSGEVIGLHVPIDPRDLVNVRSWFKFYNYPDHVLRLANADDLAQFQAIKDAYCRACDSVLEYLHPGLHDIEKPQLLCRRCGGLYDVEAFLP